MSSDDYDSFNEAKKKYRHVKTKISHNKLIRFCQLFDKYDIAYTTPVINMILIENKMYYFPNKNRLRYKKEPEEQSIFFENNTHAVFYIAKVLKKFISKEDVKIVYAKTNKLK